MNHTEHRQVDICSAMVNFAGFSASADRYHIDHSITQAISNFPTPANQLIFHQTSQPTAVSTVLWQTADTITSPP